MGNKPSTVSTIVLNSTDVTLKVYSDVINSLPITLGSNQSGSLAYYKNIYVRKDSDSPSVFTVGDNPSNVTITFNNGLYQLKNASNGTFYSRVILGTTSTHTNYNYFLIILLLIVAVIVLRYKSK